MTEEDEKNKENKLSSATGTKREYLYGSFRGKICPKCNHANHSEADCCAKCGAAL